jgi:hypothetical protein
VDMASVQQVETAVGKDHGFAIPRGSSGDSSELTNAFQLAGHNPWVAR